MKKSISDSVFANMHPRAFYRARDIADEMKISRSTAAASLREIARGGGVRQDSGRSQGVVYLKAKPAFLGNGA